MISPPGSFSNVICDLRLRYCREKIVFEVLQGKFDISMCILCTQLFVLVSLPCWY